MSRINGDKARFHRERKQKIQRRIRMQAMLKTLAPQPTPSASHAESTPKEKLA